MAKNEEMNREVVQKPDGRYIIYYKFEEAAAGKPEPKKAEIGKGRSAGRKPAAEKGANK